MLTHLSGSDKKLNTGPGAQQSEDADHFFSENERKKLWIGTLSLLRIFLFENATASSGSIKDRPRHPCLLLRKGRKECMGRKRYFIKKNPETWEAEKEWIEMNGREFYQFISSDAAKGRYYALLGNACSDESDEIIMEDNKEEYKKSESENNRRKYCRRLNGLIQGFIYLGSSVSGEEGESLTYEEVTGTEGDVTGDEAIARIQVMELRQAIETLPSEEQEMLKLYYWERKKQEEIADSLGFTQQNIQKRLMHIRKKLAELMSE